MLSCAVSCVVVLIGVTFIISTLLLVRRTQLCCVLLQVVCVVVRNSRSTAVLGFARETVISECRDVLTLDSQPPPSSRESYTPKKNIESGTTSLNTETKTARRQPGRKLKMWYQNRYHFSIFFDAPLKHQRENTNHREQRTQTAPTPPDRPHSRPRPTRQPARTPPRTPRSES